MIRNWFHDRAPKEFLAAAARRTEWSVKEFVECVQALEARMDRMSCFCWTLWQLLRDRTDLTDEDLTVLYRQTTANAQEQSDLNAVAPKCQKCGRALLRDKPQCVYCGTPVPESSTFEDLF